MVRTQVRQQIKSAISQWENVTVPCTRKQLVCLYACIIISLLIYTEFSDKTLWIPNWPQWTKSCASRVSSCNKRARVCCHTETDWTKDATNLWLHFNPFGESLNEALCVWGLHIMTLIATAIISTNRPNPHIHTSCFAKPSLLRRLRLLLKSLFQ